MLQNVKIYFIDCDCPILPINYDIDDNLIVYDVNAITAAVIAGGLAENVIDGGGTAAKSVSSIINDISSSIPSATTTQNKIGCHIKNVTNFNETFELPKNCNPSQITYIKIGFSNLTTMPLNLFTEYDHLQTLIIHVGLRTITPEHFEQSKYLQKLDLGINNNIVVLDDGIFNDTDNLEILDLSYNQILNISSNVFTENLKKLTLLYLEANEIESLPEQTFSNLNRLEILDVSRNAIEEIHVTAFRNLVHLQKLYLQRNVIRILEYGIFSDLIQLERLDCSINQIEFIEENVFENLTNLIAIELAFNQLTQLQDSQFMGANQLQSLYMSWNRIRFFNDDNNPMDTENITNVFNGITNLLILDLSFNQLEELNPKIFENLTRLENLELRETGLNGLPNINVFSRMHNLKYLDLSYNNLGTIDFYLFATLRNLQILKLQGTNLNEIDVEGINEILPELSFLDLADNDWRCPNITDTVEILRNASIEYDFGDGVMQSCDLNPFGSTWLEFYHLSPQVNVFGEK